LLFAHLFVEKKEVLAMAHTKRSIPLPFYSLFAVALAFAAPALAAELVGIYGEWGTFSDDADRRCHAMAMAAPEDGERPDGYLSVVLTPKAMPQVYARLSRPMSANAGISLTVEGRRFRLSGSRRDAFARNAQMDRALIAAMRSARSLSIETLGADGRALVDSYSLSGAASAIDAARLACR
jgi:hypothetical protein